MKKLLTLILTVVLFSCQEEVPLTFVPEETVIDEEISDPYLISVSDLHKAVQTYSPQKARGNHYVISTKFNSSGKPIFHAVNFEKGGFILFSPTKKVQPILAYSEDGHFDVNDPNDPTFIWQDEVNEYINYNEQLHLDSLESALFQWNSLLFQSSVTKSLEKIKKSRGEELDSDTYMKLQTLVMNARLEWESKGYHTYAIDELVGDEEWSAYAQQRAQEAVFPVYEDYWRNFCFIVEHDEIEYSEQKQFIKTKWHQNYPFNNSCFTPSGLNAFVGCGPLAVGQIMFYHQYPNTFNWEEMVRENNIYNSNSNLFPLYNISNFLSDVGQKCNARYGLEETTTNTIDLVSALQSYGYNASLGSEASFPFIVTAEYRIKDPMKPEKTMAGHAWIEGGYWYYRSHHYYVCWGVTESNRLTDFEQSPDKCLSRDLKYVVWGWGQQYDGWYSSFNVNPDNGQPFVNKYYINVSK